MNNKLIKYIGYALGAVCLTVCSVSCQKQIDLNSETTLTDPAFWKTEKDLFMAANYLYTFLPKFNDDGPMNDLMSDMAVSASGGLNNISNGTRTVPNNEGVYTENYKLIRAANNIIEKAASIQGNQEEINKAVAEAYFFRAFGHYRLVRAYGDVPLITKVLKIGDPELQQPRSPRADVVNQIYQDLDFASSNLLDIDKLAGASTTVATSGNEYGRVSKSAALALKSRVGLMEGTFLKFRNLDGYQQHLQASIAASKAIIDAKKHSLYTAKGENSFNSLFTYDGESYSANKEVILARLYGAGESNNVESHNHIRGPLNDGGISATRKWVESVLYKDGLPAGKSAFDSLGRETNIHTDYHNRDPRLGLTLFRFGDDYATISNVNPIPYPVGFVYHIKKYYTFQDFHTSRSYVDFLVFRYGEVLLNYAEAKYELEGALSDEDLNITINALRNRASNNNVSKLAVLTNSFANAHNLNLREEIRRERSVELAFEGFRYWDLLRWKTAETELKSSLLMRKYWSNIDYGAGSVKPTVDNNDYVVRELSSARSFDPDKDYLWPIPSQQLGLNKQLEQNPGWDN